MLAFSKAALLLAGIVGAQPSTAALPGPATNPTRVTVSQVLTMQALAGQTVVVSGRCLAPNTQAIASGSRPVAGAWQLEENGVATWVVGKQPNECGSGETVAITAQVEQATLPRFGPARSLQQYLVAR